MYAWESSFLYPVVEGYSAGAGAGEASVTRGSTAAAPLAVVHLRQPDQALDPPVCAADVPDYCLPPVAQMLALGNNP